MLLLTKTIIMKKLAFLLAFTLSCSFVFAQNYYIKFDGIEGESNSESHRGWSDIESFDQELAKSVVLTGSVRTRSSASLGKTISFVKRIDKSSPMIMEALTKGQGIPKVEMEVTNLNNVFYSYELRNVRVTKYIVMGSESDFPREEITISFEQQRVRYTEYDDTGRPKGTVEIEYN